MTAAVAQGSGTVLASYGRGVLVQAGDELLRCALLGRKLHPVCGDQVSWRSAPGTDVPRVESPQDPQEPRRAYRLPRAAGTGGR